MRGGSRTRAIVVLTLLAWLVPVHAASAYIDPGSTSVIFQAAVAAVAAVGMTLKMGWHRIRTFFRRDREPEGETVDS